MRLNGWQRIGIVLSIIWAVGVTGFVRNSEVQFAYTIFESSYRACLEGPTNNLMKCEDEAIRKREILSELYWGNIAFFSLAPILAGWIVVYSAIRIFRWVKAGFKLRRDETS